RAGFRHFVSPCDVSAFLALLPDWRELAIGLQRVVLSAARGCDGWYEPGTVAICAWEENCTRILNRKYQDDHADILRRMHVPCRPVVLPEKALCPHCYAMLGPDAWDVCDDCRGPLFDVYRDPDRDTDEVEVRYLAEFTESTVQAFLLVHVLVHELGHHHDCMT